MFAFCKGEIVEGKISRIPRSQAAKERILEAARSVFTEAGYDRATVREIADRASVVPAMLVRYFGGKAGVFTAAIKFDLSLPQITGINPSHAGPALVEHFLQRWESAVNGGDLVALLRASIDHADARDRLLAIFADQLTPAVATLTGEQQAAARAALIASQMLGLAFCRYVLGVPQLQQSANDAIVRSVGATVSSYLTSPI